MSDKRVIHLRYYCKVCIGEIDRILLSCIFLIFLIESYIVNIIVTHYIVTHGHGTNANTFLQFHISGGLVGLLEFFYEIF